MARPPPAPDSFDRELGDWPADRRWREWMGRVEAVIFAAAKPVPRATLADLVGIDCNLDLLLTDIRDELAPRPYELVLVAGGYRHQTRLPFAAAIHRSGVVAPPPALSRADMLVLMAIAYRQPINRAQIGDLIGKEVSRDVIAKLRSLNFVGAGPRSPQPGAPHTYVTTDTFLATWGFQSIHELPDMDKLQDSGLLSKRAISPLPGLYQASADDLLADGDDEEAAAEPLEYDE